MPQAQATQSKKGSYLDLAMKLGQSVERLQAGEAVDSIVQFNSLDEFKEIFAGRITEEQRTRYSQDMAMHHANTLAGSDPLPRLSNYVYGNAPLSQEDAQFAKRMFPIKVRVISHDDITVTDDITYGPFAPPVVINAGKLTFNGGSYTLRNTPFTLTADLLAFGPRMGASKYHIGIMGFDGVHPDPAPNGGFVDPPNAPDGNNSLPTSPGVCSFSGSGGNGGNGATGNPGFNGINGSDGLPSLTAVIYIGAFSTTETGSLAISTQSGAGGAGGDAGQGGQGQNGGDGGLGCNSGCEGTNGGNGGNGGTGGLGGNGGNGGNAADSSLNSILVVVPAADVPAVVPSSTVVQPGKGGAAGLGGPGGYAGLGGPGGKNSARGADGMKGNPGPSGTPGQPGTGSGNAAQFRVSGV